MVLELNLNSLLGRLALALFVFAGCALLVLVIVSKFVIATLADDRFVVTRDMLQVPVTYFPNSARLNGRLAAAELSESDRNLANAKEHAQRAVKLSPNDYRYRVTLASIEEAGGDRSAAESALLAARALAPSHWSVRYRLGNLLVRQGKLTQSLDELKIAVAANSTLLPGTLDLLWRASRGNVEALETVAGSNPKARLTLAQFLLKSSRPAEASAVFGTIDRSGRLASSTDSASFLNLLIAAGELQAARDFWGEIAGGERQSLAVWNGGFESDLMKDFTQFDWQFGKSEYARLSIDPAVAHSGSRSLKVEFVGRDTTQLDNEIRQLVLVRPGARYALECYVKTNGLETPEGPRLVVANTTWIAASEPVAQGSNDWQRLAVEFVAPPNPKNAMSAVYISLKRKPKFSYDEPTRGDLWLDDFSLKEQ